MKDRHLPPEDRGEYIALEDPSLSRMKVMVGNPDTDRVEYMPMSESGFPDSIFIVARVVSLIALILGIPALIFSFKESIMGYSSLFLIHIVVVYICRARGYSPSNY